MEKTKIKVVKKDVLGRQGHSLKMGIIGLQQSGKTSTFEILSQLQGKDEKNCGEGKIKCEVHDPRIAKLAGFYNKIPQYPTLTIIDIAANIYSSDTGLGTELISQMPAVDGYYFVVKVFENEGEEIDPIQDLETVKEELIKRDKLFAEKRIIECEKNMKKGDMKSQKEAKDEKETLDKVLKLFNNGNMSLRETDWTNEEIAFLNTSLFLTSKPIVYILNLSEEDFMKKKNKWLGKINSWVSKNGGGTLVALSTEYELKLMNSENNSISADSPLHKIIRSGYTALDFICFFTVGETMVKTWTIRPGYKGPQAASALHSDFEKKYISADVVNYNDLFECGSEELAKEAGKMKVEGKNYDAVDGDIFYFKFNTADPVKKK